MDFLKIIDETQAGFQNIADILINQFAIQTHDSVFRMIDLEFYWDSETHQDKSTYQRNYVDPRKNLGQHAGASGTDQLNYRFFITP